MEQIELYQQFERVVVDAEHGLRETEEAREEQIRTSGRRENREADVVLQPRRSYAQRVLDLMRKPHENWDREDYALAARVVEDAHFTAIPAAHEPRDGAREKRGSRKIMVVRDEFDRRLWGLPPRPNRS